MIARNDFSPDLSRGKEKRVKAPTKPHRSSFFFRTCLVLTVIQSHFSHAYGQPQQMQVNTKAEKTEVDEALSVELHSKSIEATEKRQLRRKKNLFQEEHEAVTEEDFENEGGLSRLNDEEREDNIAEGRFEPTPGKTEVDEALSVELYSHSTEATDKGQVRKKNVFQKEDEAVTEQQFENEGLSRLHNEEREEEDTIVEERCELTPGMTEVDEGLGVELYSKSTEKKKKSPYQVHSTTTKEVLDRMHTHDRKLSDGMQNRNARHDDFDTRRRKLFDKTIKPSEAATISDALQASGDGKYELGLDILASTVVAGVCFAASFAAAAPTAGVSVAFSPLLCAAMGFWAGIVFSTFDFLGIGSWFGSPKNDDAWWTVEAADRPYADGNALGVTYHRSGGTDDDSLGNISRGEIKTSQEDLDKQWLVAIEVRVEDTDDICVKNMAFKIGKEPSGTGQVENIAIPAAVVTYITRTKFHDNKEMCIYFGDEEGAIGNFKFHWPSALICQRNFGTYFSLDFAECLRYSMYSYDVMKSDSYRRMTFRSGNVPSLPSWYQNPMGMVKSKNGSSNGRNLCFDLQNYNTDNYNPVTLIVCKDNSAQNFDFDRDGRIRSQVDPTKCVEAGSGGTLYAKLYIYDCHSGDWQRWIKYTSGRIKNVHHRKFIGLAYCKAEHGGKLELRWYEGGSCGNAQKWTW